MDIRAHNRIAWDRLVDHGNEWTVPVSEEIIRAAKSGQFEIYLTPTKPVPQDWLQDISGKRALCLASGGGQQGPVLAAAGAEVTVLDNSPKQLSRDHFVAEREGLSLATVEGDMADLSVFDDRSFDLIVHPVSNCFVEDVRPVWMEAFRVLDLGGTLIAGFNNPVIYLFDFDLMERTGELEVRHKLPYSDIDHLSDKELQRFQEEEIPLEFSHTLEDQIGGQIAAGFVITGFFEDFDQVREDNPLRNYMPTFIATRALKP